MAELDFRALVEAMPDVLAVLDREQRYVFVNAAVEHATGVAPTALIGKRTDEVMSPDDAAIWRHALAHVLATGESRTIECRFVTPRGPRVFAAILTRIAGERVCVLSRDVTAGALERARLSEAHQTSEDQLRFALTAARAATWSLDLGTMQSQRDVSYAALVGGEATRVNADFMTIHPDDRQTARDAYERSLRERVPYEPEVRIRRDDGSYMWVRAHGRVICDADGKPRTMAGVIVDIDEARQANLRAETLHRLAASFASELDEDRLVQMITDEITKLIGAQVTAFSFAGRPDTITSGDPTLLADLRAERIASVLTVAVTARSGETFGTLWLGHAEHGRFTSEHARLVTGIASHAAVALENAHLYKTVREQKEQLELAVERARVADRRKDEFLAMLGHEMRNPLAPIATALDLMELKDGADVRKERAVIRRQVQHLSRLIDDLLDVSRITRGKIQLSREIVELGDVLAKAIEMASPLLEKRLQRLTVDVPRTGLLVDADPTRLAQVFQNLLTNAAKYSEPRSHVELRARAEGDRVVVEVRDEGMGISQELLPRMFDMFAQGERALDRAEGGLGIGLTIAKSLCDMHGGTIDARSAGPGKGSTFIVMLPRARPATAAASARATERMPAIATGTRVLVVDDNVDAAHMLRDFLQALGHEPAIAYDAPSALELVARFRPDIAVVDIGLPVMNGYELARRLREQLGHEKLRLIAVTGYGQDTDRARAFAVGFDHHLIKPIELDALLSLLGKN
jgi:PAS domain S-box-containing protein